MALGKSFHLLETQILFFVKEDDGVRIKKSPDWVTFENHVDYSLACFEHHRTRQIV